MTQQTSTNPGCVDPASQSFAPVPATPSKLSPRPLSLPVTSNGEIQPRSPASLTGGTPATDVGSASVVQSTGEAQLRNLVKPEKAATTCRGLPANVHAGSAHPGGLATDVVVK